jgi:hypothetical protein
MRVTRKEENESKITIGTGIDVVSVEKGLL